LFSKNGHPGETHVQQMQQVTRIRRFLLPRIVEHYTLSLTNLRLREKLRLESIHDSLTGLYNRRYMEAALEQEAARIKRHKTLLGIIMIDVDHFKAFNDQHGHHVGDAVLQELGRFLKGHIRGEDVACRYGGEEFLLILSGASLENTKLRAEEFWEKLRDLKIHYQDRDFSITASIGVAALPCHGPDVMDVVKAADDALYLAKERGRNHVVVAPC
jgi:diguanylate cyclase (GGDEF)-like protein